MLWTDDGRVIGRDAEVAVFDALLQTDRSRLVLLIGSARSGKAGLLRHLYAQAAAAACTIVPGEVADGAEPWLRVDKDLAVDEFRRAVAQPNDPTPSGQQLNRNPIVVLVYGYRPEEDFHEFFTRDFVPEIKNSPTPPRIVVVAGTAGDVARLDGLATDRVLLGPLPRDQVVAELRAIDAGIDDHLSEHEIEVYANAVATSPSLLGALRQLLPLTSAPAVVPPEEPPE
jgi:hypothetical protein